MSRHSTSEAALEAWVDCKPDGYLVEASRLPELLPFIAARLPNRSPGERAREISALFACQEHEPPVFVVLLRPHKGTVHFIYFWKAFGEAARVAASATPGAGAAEGQLEAEVETLRDSLLRIIEESGGGHRPLADRVVPAIGLLGEAHRAASMSVCPRFWQAAVAPLAHILQPSLSNEAGGETEVQLGLDQLASLLLSWLQDAALWEQEMLRSTAPQPQPWQLAMPRSMSGMSGGQDFASAVQDAAISVMARSSVPMLARSVVNVNIYDVSQQEGIQKLNRILAHSASPIKFGGVFHAGVEVDGIEWAFGAHWKETQTGVTCSKPRMHEQHHYRQTVQLGWTPLRPEEVAAIISELVEEYPGRSYDLLRRNCCHFADDFSRRLGVGGIPAWVHRLARIGAMAENVLHGAQHVKNCIREATEL